MQMLYQNALLFMKYNKPNRNSMISLRINLFGWLLSVGKIMKKRQNVQKSE